MEYEVQRQSLFVGACHIKSANSILTASGNSVYTDWVIEVSSQTWIRSFLSKVQEGIGLVLSFLQDGHGRHAYMDRLVNPLATCAEYEEWLHSL